MFDRKKFADSAEAEAKLGLVWSPGSEATKYTKKYEPVFGKGRFSWCAAWVTWNGDLAGLDLPIKDPAPFGYTFALVEAWQQWAIWANLYHDHDEKFVPERGDIVCFDWNQLDIDDRDTDWEDHIGVFLHMDGEYYVCAEGNTGNRTAIKRRKSIQIQGFIRIPHGYVFDKKTVKLPGSEPLESSLLRKGDKGEKVRTMQTLLKTHGYYTGIVDGNFGPRTLTAVIAFQAAKGLTPDGIVGPITQAKLAELPTPKPQPAPAPGEVPPAGSLEWYSHWWARCQLRDDSASRQRIEWSRSKVIANATRYSEVEAATMVPWQLIAAIHGLEASFDFRAVLHNGERIIGTGKRTKLVPAGRGPFATWEAAAIDALKYDGLAGRDNWTMPKMLQFAEKYNGTGYLKKYIAGKTNVMSAYVWACTGVYKGGKYVADGVWSDTAMSEQCGVAATFKALGMV